MHDFAVCFEHSGVYKGRKVFEYSLFPQTMVFQKNEGKKINYEFGEAQISKSMFRLIFSLRSRLIWASKLLRVLMTSAITFCHIEFNITLARMLGARIQMAQVYQGGV